MSDTHKLRKFIKQFSIPYTHLSTLSKRTISNIVQLMKLAVQSYNPNSIQISDIQTDSFPKGTTYTNVIKNIRDDFENIDKIGKTFSCSIGSRNFRIHIIKPLHSNENFERAFHKIFVWLFVCNHLANTKCSTSLDVFIYLTENKKTIPDKIDVFDREHSNTAFTYACKSSQNEIYIFRNEEWFKVFLHETFHAFGFDFATMNDENHNKLLFSIFPIVHDFRFYETYCETWAEIINIIFLTLHEYPCREHSINMQKLTKKIEHYLHEEQIFSLFQSAKVLKHMNLSYRELFDKTTKEKYKENTHVFSYYILKSLFMFYYNDFMEWCSQNNHKNSFQFIHTDNHVEKLFEFVKLKYNSPEFLRTFEIFENWHKKSHSISFETTTMRMSIFG